MSYVARDIISGNYCTFAETLSGRILCWLFYLSLKTEYKEIFYRKVVVRRFYLSLKTQYKLKVAPRWVG